MNHLRELSLNFSLGSKSFKLNSRHLKYAGAGVAAAALFTVRYLSTGEHSGSLFAKENEAKEKLISVHLFTRHGARTPLMLINGLQEAEYHPELMDTFVKAKYTLRTLDNRPFSNDLSIYDKQNYEKCLKGQIPRGQLTKVGEEQLYNLGKRLRQRYINELKFLSPNYDTNQIYTRSSHYKRTINSAKSMLAGMYNFLPNESTNSPFIIHVEEMKDDYLFPNASNCKYHAEMYKHFRKLQLYTTDKDYLEKFKELHKELQVYHMDNDKNMNFTMFRDDLTARRIHGLPIPKHLEELYKLSEKYANTELSAACKHNIKISCGQLVGMISKNLAATLENDKQNKDVDYQRFKYYSAHDSTLNALLIALNLEHKNELWPPFGADLIIELWKKNNEQTKNSDSNYFVKIYYCGKPVEMLDLHDKSDHFKCSINEFLTLLAESSIDRATYDKLCGQTFNG